MKYAVFTLLGLAAVTLTIGVIGAMNTPALSVAHFRFNSIAHASLFPALIAAVLIRLHRWKRAPHGAGDE